MGSKPSVARGTRPQHLPFLSELRSTRNPILCILLPMRQAPAWSGNRPADSEAARERLLEAAIHCIQLYGVAKTAISDVAREAGVTRRTVYRYFEDREARVGAALVRGVRDFTGRARTLLETFEEPEDMVVEGLCFALKELPRDPVLGRTLRGGELVLDAPTLTRALNVLRPLIEPVTKAAGWTPQERDECSELMLRLALSLLASPLPDDLRGFLRRRLIPSLGFHSPAPPHD